MAPSWVAASRSRSHAITALPRPTTQFALPEVTLGIIPGRGRHPTIADGSSVPKRRSSSSCPRNRSTRSQAIELGFLDADRRWRPARCGDRVRARAARGRQGSAPHGRDDRRSGHRDGADVRAHEGAGPQARIRNRNAGLVAVDAVRKAVAEPDLAEGLEYETARVNECKLSGESRGAVHVFFAERDSRRVPGLPDDVRATPVRSAGVIGAGTMGGGIAICFANAGIPVTLVDANAAGLERGLAGIERIYQSMVDRGRLTPAEKAQRLAIDRARRSTTSRCATRTSSSKRSSKISR